MQSVPELARLVENLQIERTPEGLRIQIVDQAESSMFPLGSARMYPATEALLRRVARAIARLPNKLSLAGHTDGIAYRRTDGYDNWSCPWIAPTPPAASWSPPVSTRAGSRP